MGRVGFAEGRTEWKAGAIASQNWGSGGIMVAYEHIYREALKATSRPELYDNDFTEFGGAPYSSYAQPGNVSVGSDLYGVPAGHSSDLKLSDLNTRVNCAIVWEGLDALPEIKSDAVTVKARRNYSQDLRYMPMGNTIAGTSQLRSGLTRPPCRCPVRTPTAHVTQAMPKRQFLWD